MTVVRNFSLRIRPSRISGVTRSADSSLVVVTVCTLTRQPIAHGAVPVVAAGSGLSARLVALHVGPLAPSTLPALLVSVLASALGCPVDRLPDATPRLALLEADAWAVGFLADSPVGVGDVVTLPVVLDLGQGAPPGAATAHAGGRLAKLTQVGGSVGAGEQLGGAAAGMPAPAILTDHLTLSGQDVGVVLQPCLVFGLGVAGHPCPVGGAVGLLAGHRQGLLGQGVAVAGVLGAAGGRRRPMLGVLVAVGGVGDQAGLVGWGLVDELGEPVPLGAELVGGHAPQVQGGGGADVDRQLLAAVAAQALGQLLADVAPLGVGHVQLGGARLGVGDPVEPGGAAGAGVLHLVPVAVLGAAHVHQRMLAGQPLGLVPGGGIAKVDGAPVGVAPGPPAGPLVQVATRQGDLPAVRALQPHRQLPLLGVDRDDLAAAAVGDPQRGQRVLAAHHQVTDRNRPVTDPEAVGAELAGLVAELLAGAVELIGHAAQPGQDRDLLAGVGKRLLEQRPPVRQHGLLGLGRGLGGHHPAVLSIGADSGVDVAVAGVRGGLALPGVTLATIDGQGTGAKPQPEPAEAATGLDRGQLAVVADQHHLRVGLLGVVKQAVQLAGAEHRGLIDHQHRAPIQQRAIPVPRQFFLSLPTPLKLPGVAGDPQRVGLAGAWLTDHHRDAGAALGDVADHGGLVVADGGVGPQRGTQGVVRTHCGLLVGAANPRLDQPLFDGEQLGGGIAVLPRGVLGHDADGSLGHEPVGQVRQLVRADLSLRAGELVKHLADRPLVQSSGVLSGVPSTLVQSCIQSRAYLVAGPDLDGSGDVADQPLGLDPQRAGLVLPAAVQRLGGLMLLGLAGGVDGELDQPAGARLALLALQPRKLGGDLLVPLGELLEHLVGHAHQLAVAPTVRGRPANPEGAGQLLLVGRPVDRVRGGTMVEQVTRIQRPPLPVLAAGAVVDDQVGVQQRIPRPAGAVDKPGRQQPRPANMLGAVVAAAGADLAVEVGDRLADRVLVGGQDRRAGLLVAQPVQHRDALGGTKHQVPRGHRVGAGWTAELLAGLGVAPGEQVLERLRRAGAFKTERGGAAAKVLAGGLAVAGQVLLAVLGDLAGVVVGPPGRQLVQVRGHQRSAARRCGTIPSKSTSPPSSRSPAAQAHAAISPSGRIGRALRVATSPAGRLTSSALPSAPTGPHACHLASSTASPARSRRW